MKLSYLSYKASLLFIFVYLFACCGCKTQYNNATSVKDPPDLNETAFVYDTILNIEGTFKLDQDIDLEGCSALIPEGVTLVAGKGRIKNGTLIGSNTKISSLGPMFHNVSIQGLWIAESISTSMFDDLSYNNSLRDVLSLSNAQINNHITIEKGCYHVSAKSFLGALSLMSNTHITIDGDIHLEPNSFKGCYIINVYQCENIIIDGSGTLIGDKHTHTGTEGQWGHGINILSSANVTIKGLHIEDCWGDCIYVGDNSKNVRIIGCSLNNSRRQGISITSAGGVLISHCQISNVAGSPPQYAIDIEPNENEQVDNVIIDSVTCKDCVGGITMWHPDHSSIGSVTIRNCHISGTTAKRPVVLELADKVVFKDCYVEGYDKVAVSATRVNDLQMSGNTIITTNETPIAVIKCSKTNVKNNQINVK